MMMMMMMMMKMLHLDNNVQSTVLMKTRYAHDQLMENTRNINV